MRLRLERFSYRFADQVLNSKLSIKQEIEEILTHPGLAELVAAGLDANAALRGFEAKSARDAIFENLDVRVLEFDDFAAVDADEVVVIRVLEEIRIVVLLLTPKVDFAQEASLDEEGKSSVKGGARSLGIDFPGHVPELVSRKVLLGAEGGLDDHIPLSRSPEALRLHERVDLFQDRGIHSGEMMTS